MIQDAQPTPGEASDPLTMSFPADPNQQRRLSVIA